ncbi:hypothetical protein ILYODFUR_005884, partial [Ilyodon furcidens]
MTAKECKQWRNAYETSHRRKFVFRPHSAPVLTSFEDSYSPQGPLGSTVYNEEYHWKPTCKADKICTGTASGHQRNNPHLCQSFFVWWLQRNAPHYSVVFPWKGLPSDREICKALGAQYHSTYTCDFQASSQGRDDNNKRDEKLAPLCNGFRNRHLFLLTNISQFSSTDWRAVCRGI